MLPEEPLHTLLMQTKAVYWSINATAWEGCTEKERITARYSITSFHSLGHSEMLFTVPYVMKAARKFHRDNQLVHISVSTKV